MKIKTKVYLKIGIYTFLLLAISLIMGCHVPFLTKRLHGKIKPGQDFEDAVTLIEDMMPRFRGGYSSCTNAAGAETPYLFESNCYDYIRTNIKKGTATNTEFTVLSIGPGMQKNDFIIKLTPDGKVDSLTPIRNWD
ncbi:hypothetical protein BVX94_00135 [bacterium B17]|nr:hypothetical protein BVX94_00135 [bacterium B17]